MGDDLSGLPNALAWRPKGLVANPYLGADEPPATLLGPSSKPREPDAEINRFFLSPT
jgi:hypothetical protein